jgi:hypothetical protein
MYSSAVLTPRFLPPLPPLLLLLLLARPLPPLLLVLLLLEVDTALENASAKSSVIAGVCSAASPDVVRCLSL